MKVDTVGKMLIAAGVIFLLYAMSMPVSVGDSGIVNIHLISQRQNNLLFGGLMFLAGIILFAVFKLKQTKEESNVAEKLLQERTEKAKVLVQQSSEGASLAAKSLASRLDQKPLSTILRIAAGFLLGGYSAYLAAAFCLFVLSTFTEYYVDTLGLVLIVVVPTAAFIAYAFRKINTIKVLTHLVIGAAVATMTIPLHGMLIDVKRQECKNATHVSPYCMKLLYHPEELGE